MTLDLDFHRIGNTPDPYAVYDELRSTGSVVHDEASNEWALLGYADCRRVLSEPGEFDSRPVAERILGGGENGQAGDGAVSVSAVTPLIGLDGEPHGRLRRIVSRAFTPRRVNEQRQFARRAVEPMISELLEAGGGDVQSVLCDKLPPVIIAELIGVGEGEHESLVRWARAMVLAVFGEPDAEDQREIDAALVEMATWMDAEMAGRDRRDATDVFSLLTRAEAGDEHLSEDELRVFLFTLLVAGSFTTSFLLGNGFLRLVHEPELVDALRADPDATPAFVEEVLRHDSPAQVVQRRAVESVELGGVQVPAEGTLNVMIGAANRDPGVFEQPSTFDLSRRDPPHLGFGHGPHFCLGAGLARLEADVVFRAFVDRVGTLESAGPVEWSTIPMFRGPTSLPLAIHP